MTPDYQVVTREITPKGKAYLVVRRCAPEELYDLVGRAAAELRTLGAAEVYAASVDPGAPLEERTAEGIRLEHVHDMLVLERGLADRPRRAGRLTLEPLRRAQGGLWLELHNEGFFEIPNSATYDREELEEALGRDRDCGFALVDGTPAGVYELALGGCPPEIEGIALLRPFRGRGLGRELLYAAMERLAERGAAGCRLTVSTANETAWTLYRDAGFRSMERKSRWFRVLAGE